MVQTSLNLPAKSALEELLGYSLQAAGASYGKVYLKATGNGAFSLVAGYGARLPGNEDPRLAERVISNDEVVVIEEEAVASSYGLAGALPAICVPLQIEDQTRGALLVGFPDSRDGHTESNRQQLARLVARLVGAELLCGELRQTLVQREEHLNQLITSTIEAQEAEREWICLEVHDGVTQSLASAFQLLQAYEGTAVEKLEEARPHVLRAAALVRQAIRESREVINSITPAPLSELGLVTTLRQELRRFEEETGCWVDFNAPRIRLPREMEVALYRIIHEAVTNVRKHANSNRLQVKMDEKGDQVAIRIKDWGVGFDPGLPERSAIGRSTGLFSMRKRAEILGGSCEVKTHPHQGTEIIVVVPLLPVKEHDRQD